MLILRSCRLNRRLRKIQGKAFKAVVAGKVKGDALGGVIMRTLTKAELAELLNGQVVFNKREAKELVESFFDAMSAALENGREVKLPGFGNFKLRDKTQRPGRNPKNGEMTPISARRVVTFRPSKKLKAVLQLQPHDSQHKTEVAHSTVAGKNDIA